MELTGTHTVDAGPDKVWSLLMNTEALARITPGISRLEATGENTFKAISNVKIGPVSGSFAGDLEMVDIIPNKGFRLMVTQNSKIGNVAAEVGIKLSEPEPGKTEISFDGLAKLSGLLARTGNRVLSGVASTLTKQFFQALEAEIKNS